MVVGGGFEPPKAHADRFTVCSLWPLGNPTRMRKSWSWRWDSNPQPADYKSAALPIELRQPSRAELRYISATQCQADTLRSARAASSSDPARTLSACRKEGHYASAGRKASIFCAPVPPLLPLWIPLSSFPRLRRHLKATRPATAPVIDGCIQACYIQFRFHPARRRGDARTEHLSQAHPSGALTHHARFRPVDEIDRSGRGVEQAASRT